MNIVTMTRAYASKISAILQWMMRNLYANVLQLAIAAECPDSPTASIALPESAMLAPVMLDQVWLNATISIAVIPGHPNRCLGRNMDFHPLSSHELCPSHTVLLVEEERRDYSAMPPGRNVPQVVASWERLHKRLQY
jgi:hypothetical protein